MIPSSTTTTIIFKFAYLRNSYPEPFTVPKATTEKDFIILNLPHH